MCVGRNDAWGFAGGSAGGCIMSFSNLDLANSTSTSFPTVSSTSSSVSNNPSPSGTHSNAKLLWLIVIIIVPISGMIYYVCWKRNQQLSKKEEIERIEKIIEKLKKAGYPQLVNKFESLKSVKLKEKELEDLREEYIKKMSDRKAKKRLDKILKIQKEICRMRSAGDISSIDISKCDELLEKKKKLTSKIVDETGGLTAENVKRICRLQKEIVDMESDIDRRGWRLSRAEFSSLINQGIISGGDVNVGYFLSQGNIVNFSSSEHNRDEQQQYVEVNEQIRQTS